MISLIDFLQPEVKNKPTAHVVYDLLNSFGAELKSGCSKKHGSKTEIVPGLKIGRSPGIVPFWLTKGITKYQHHFSKQEKSLEFFKAARIFEPRQRSTLSRYMKFLISSILQMLWLMNGQNTSICHPQKTKIFKLKNSGTKTSKLCPFFLNALWITCMCQQQLMFREISVHQKKHRKRPVPTNVQQNCCRRIVLLRNWVPGLGKFAKYIEKSHWLSFW